jgi:hypothetical protein
LEKYIDDIAVLVNRTIEIMLLSPDPNKQLIYMPGITVLTVPSTQSGRISGTEFPTPSANCFI